MNRELLYKYAKQYNVNLDDMALDRFEETEERLIRWNTHINLTSITDPDDILIKHFVDSLTGVGAVDFATGASVIDVGCGAGFPGLPILFARPDLEFTFIDSAHKKIGFVKEQLRLAGLVGITLHERAEDYGKKSDFREKYDYAVSRAMASLDKLAEYCLPFVRVGGTFIAYKGRNDEVALGRAAINKLGGKIERVSELNLPNGDNRHLIIIKKVEPTPSKYPRRAKKIATHPIK